MSLGAINENAVKNGTRVGGGGRASSHEEEVVADGAAVVSTSECCCSRSSSSSVELMQLELSPLSLSSRLSPLVAAALIGHGCAMAMI